MSARIKRIYNAELEAGGAQGIAAPFQKRGDYSVAQKGNSNRKGTGKQEKMTAKKRI